VLQVALFEIEVEKTYSTQEIIEGNPHNYHFISSYIKNI